MSGAAAIPPQGRDGLFRRNPARTLRVAIAIRFSWRDRERSPGPPEGTGGVHPVLALRTALDRYQRAGSPAALDVAFAAAARAVAERRGERANDPPDVTELERLFEELPEYEELVEVAVEQTERSVESAGARLWEWFGLETSPPTLERGGALARAAAGRLRVRAARRAGGRLARTAAAEAVRGPVGGAAHGRPAARRRGPVAAGARRALRVGVAPVRAARPVADARAGAPARQRRRHGRPRCSAGCRGGWPSGADVERLPAELEAAFVETRTPDRLA